MAKVHSKSGSVVNKAPENRALLHREIRPAERQTQSAAGNQFKRPVAKGCGFETGFTFTVKILNGCLVLIPDSEDTRAIKQQNQQQQAQLNEIKFKINELVSDQKAAKG